MRIKRVLQGTALTALAAAAWMGAGSDASAAVKANYAKIVEGADGGYQLEVEADNGDIEIMAAVVKPNKDGKVKISAWDVYEGNKANIDLSKLNVTTDNFIALKTDSMDKPAFVGIAAASKKNKVTFNAGTAMVSKIETTIVKTTAEHTGKVEYRTANGSKWADFNKNNALTAYQYQGATLYLRVPVDSGKTTEKKDLIDITNDKNNTEKINVKQVGSLPGKETKLNIGKQANGPKVAVDYVKGTVTIPKGSVYRVVAGAATGAVIGDSGLSDKLVATPGAILAKAKNGSAEKGVLEVRKAAVTNTTKGKAASKWTRVDLVMPKAVEIKTATVATTSSIDATVSGKAIGLQYTVDKKKVANGGLIFDNKTGFSVDYFVGSAAPTEYVKSIKAVKDTKKVTIKSLKDGDKIFVRVSGDKTKKEWAGAWGELLTVAMPK